MSQASAIGRGTRVRGNIETPSLFIDKGVMFEGQCRMEGLTPPVATKSAPPAIVLA